MEDVSMSPVLRAVIIFVFSLGTGVTVVFVGCLAVAEGIRRLDRLALAIERRIRK
jgi:hypothetical protein